MATTTTGGVAAPVAETDVMMDNTAFVDATNNNNNNNHQRHDIGYEFRHKMLPAIRNAVLCWIFVYATLAVLFALLWITSSSSSSLTVEKEHVLLAQQYSNASSTLLPPTTTTTDALKGDEDDDHDYEEEEEEEEDLEIASNATTTTTTEEEEEERRPRIVEEEIVYVQLPDPYQNDMEEIEWTLEDLQSAIDQLRQGLFQPVQQQLDIVEDSLLALEDEPYVITSTSTETVELESLSELLAVESLSSLSGEALQEYFDKAKEELEYIVTNHLTIPWDQVEAILNKSYPRTDAADPISNTTMVDGCPVPLLSDLNQSLARDTDLAREVQDVQRWLQTLSQDLLHASVLRTQQRQWEQAIAQLAAQAKVERDIVLAQEIEDKNRGQNCITQEQVLEMVEEGLVALEQHHKDINKLRAVLEQKTNALEPNAPVILDAIFLPKQQPQQRPSSSWLVSTLTTSQTINLRQVLDTPLLSQQVPLWLDAVEKLIGGHLDVVDSLLDWLVQQPPPPSVSAVSTDSKTTVGHLIVAHFLELAGKVNLTIPEMLKELPRQRSGEQR
jgi:hypothetical protein